MIEFLHSPMFGFGALWVFSALVHTMPVPLGSERWYAWFYNFAQLIGANLSKLGQKQTFSDEGVKQGS